MLLGVNEAYNRVNSLLIKWVDNYRPTAFTSSDVSTGTKEPEFDSLFHDLIPLWVSYKYATENGLASAKFFYNDILLLEKELTLFYGSRNFTVFTVTIATPGVFTSKNHNLHAGDKVSLRTTGALPTGLSEDTYYFVISTGIDEDDFRLSATENGSAINTTGSQSGTHYFSREVQGRMRVNIKDSNR